MGDIYVPPRQWVNAYALSGIAVGGALLVQNKGPLPVVVLEAAAQPAADSEAGYKLEHCAAIEVSAGSVGVWVLALASDARLFVQEA